jgi:Do/DeqQ family serine protease
MMKKQKLLIFFLLPVFYFGCLAQNEKKNELLNIDQLQNDKKQTNKDVKVSYVGLVDFREAAKIATPGVVHIKSTFLPERQLPKEKEDNQDFYNEMPDFFDDFFKRDPFFRRFEFRYPESPSYPRKPLESSGSAVVITNDGYIITNNHVVKGANKIEVILYDRRSYEAAIIGFDPQTDLALIKIKEKGLQFIEFGNSDSVEVGEWVVAVGNPFNLASTVTAGIVSAKARNINILKDQGAIESFIQTDAAINPGNSGGALVNLEGKLIGINTAIATPTGVYAGYAFAIPSNIIKKVINDLLNYGMVQRGYLGITIRDLNSELSEELNIDRTIGVYVDSVLADGSAKQAGIKEKDVIVEIDGMETSNAPRLQEIIAGKKPGEKIKISLIRDGKKKELFTILKNKEGNTKIVKKGSTDIFNTLGIELEELSSKEKKKYNVNNGVKVLKLSKGKISKQTEIRVGFVITKVNNKMINSIKEFISQVEEAKGGIMLEGRYPGDPFTYYYAFGI